MYTAVYIHVLYTYTAVYMGRGRVLGRVHGRIRAVYVAVFFDGRTDGRVHVYTGRIRNL